MILALFYLGPVAYNVVLSLQKVSLFQAGGVGGEWVGFDNFRRILADPATLSIFTNSTFWLTAVTVILRLVIGLGLAMLVNAAVLHRFKLRWLARSLVIVPWAVPPVVAVVLWKFLLDPQDGALNQLLVQMGWAKQGIAVFQQVSTVWAGIEAVIVWRELPFVVLMFMAALQTIPQEMYEAAEVDGASWWQRFTHITVPLLRSVTAAIALLTTIWTFNNFIYVWLSTKGGPGTFTEVLGTAIYREAFVNYDVGRASALSVIATLLMFVFAVVYFLRMFRVKDED